MSHKFPTIPQLMRLLKPSKNCNHMELAARYLEDIKTDAKLYGEIHYEIGSLYTRDGHPHVFYFD